MNDIFDMEVGDYFCPRLSSRRFGRPLKIAKIEWRLTIGDWREFNLPIWPRANNEHTWWLFEQMDWRVHVSGLHSSFTSDEIHHFFKALANPDPPYPGQGYRDDIDWEDEKPDVTVPKLLENWVQK